MKNLYEELKKYSQSDYYPFHMPGHKRQTFGEPGRQKEDSGAETAGKQEDKKGMSEWFGIDITEIEGFDDLHHGTGLLLELQKKAADIYHAEESFFLINGSTGGILSAVSAVSKEGGRLLMARNCHKSVYHAAFLNRLRTEYLVPEIIEDYGIQGEITKEQVEEKLQKCEDVCAVVITSPTYDGILSDVKGIAEIVHRYKIPLIVDEAHGAHFILCKTLLSAVECGADIVINSTHKTLPAMTQTALLHVQGELADRDRLKKYLSIYQSSSPSYVLMASIDCCMDFIKERGVEWTAALMRFRKKIDEEAKKFKKIHILPIIKETGQNDLWRGKRDPGKLVISVKGTGMSGGELYKILLEKYHLQMEMAAPGYVLGILTGMDREEGVDRLITALSETDRELTEAEGNPKEPERQKTGEEKAAGQETACQKICLPAVRYTLYEAEKYKKLWVECGKAEGYVSGEFVYLYPPGIPLIAPGEVIDEKVLKKAESAGTKGLVLWGLANDGKRICILDESAEL